MNNGEIESTWKQEIDELLKYLYEQMKIYDWESIAKEVNSSYNLCMSAIQCRNRMIEIKKIEDKGQWEPQEERYLYRLHDKYANKWAIISQHLLGRSDNAVKNHFYSKLRKSLRVLNKIAKTHLKKTCREVSGQVIYKLTEATDQIVKQNSDLPQETATLCFDLKNQMLQYNADLRTVQNKEDYSQQKMLIQGLLKFNKIYKKKSKKNMEETIKQKNKEGEMDKNMGKESKNERNDQQKIEKNKTKNQKPYQHRELKGIIEQKKTVINVIIKQPLVEKDEPQKKEIYRIDNDAKIKTNVEDILRAQGVLEDGEYGNNNSLIPKRDFSRRSRSSFSVRSESQNPDMLGDSQIFGGNFVYQGFKQYSDMSNESYQLFQNQQQ